MELYAYRISLGDSRGGKNRNIGLCFDIEVESDTLPTKTRVLQEIQNELVCDGNETELSIFGISYVALYLNIQTVDDFTIVDGEVAPEPKPKRLKSTRSMPKKP